MELMFGLSAVDQMNEGRQTRAIANGWMHQFPVPGRRLRTTLGVALVALGTRLAPGESAATEQAPVRDSATGPAAS